MKKLLILTTALTLSTAVFADDTTLNTINQFASAMGMGTNANVNVNANTSLTTQPVLYSDAALKSMDCLDLELAKTKMNNAVARTKSNATDLLATEKAAAGQQKSNVSATADIAALILAQRGGKTAEYAKIYQGMQGDTTANSNALDIEIKSLGSMNEQLSEIQVYQKYKNCNGTTTYTPPPAIMPVVTPVAPRITPVTVIPNTTTTVTTKIHTKEMKKKSVKRKSTHHHH
jgi:hypothetical protein